MSSSIQTQQTLNRALEMIGLPSKELTEQDFLESACHEALVYLADGHIKLAKETLRKALK